MASTLEPPPKASTDVEDPGAHELESSDEEHFSDASEGKQEHEQGQGQGQGQGPVPTTRVEKVDDEPSHGEAPGTAAFDQRTADAEPDEVEVIPEPETDEAHRSIPTTVVEKVDPGQPSHGEVEGTLAHEMRRSDAQPDVITTAPEVSRTDLEEDDKGAGDEAHEAGEAANDDDFDDFEEGAAGGDGDDDDDFGAFDEGFGGGADADGAEDENDGVDDQNAPDPVANAAPSQLPDVPPLIDYRELRHLDDITTATTPYIQQLFPANAAEKRRDGDGEGATPDDEVKPSFLTERSQSLWEQLVAPPPLQPPDWIRSRIRRLFLVSLGVPVDLDEILPASKQKKLVLPSLEAELGRRRRRSEASRGHAAVERLKGGGAVGGAGKQGSPSPSRGREERRGRRRWAGSRTRSCGSTWRASRR